MDRSATRTHRSVVTFDEEPQEIRWMWVVAV
jgi:hypothetical protein